jgi:hypothetical protein
MTRSKRLVVWLTLAVAVFLAPAGATSPEKQIVSISLLSLPIDSGEQVVGFHFQVTSGRIAQLPDAPIGWSVSVENDPSWNTKFEGSVIVAAAALDASFFKDFVLLEKNERSEVAFDVRGEVDVSRDFSTYRKIEITMNQITIRRSAAKEWRNN